MNELTSMAQEKTEDAEDEFVLFDVKGRSYNVRAYRRVINKLIKGSYKVIPRTKCLIKRGGENITQEWQPPVEAFLVKKHTRVYNLLKHTVVRRTFDYKTECELIHSFERKLREIQTEYDDLKKDFMDNFSRLTSCDFWENYLKLK